MDEHDLDQPVRVLLCEDSIVSRMIAESACERLGCAVVACDNIETAFGLIGTPNGTPAFDFVLTDLHLTGQSGLDLIRHIRALGWSGFRLPIAVMTAQPSPADEAACLSAGGQFVLAKPVSETALGDVIDRARPLAPRREGDRILQDVQLVRRYHDILSSLRTALVQPPEHPHSPSPERTRLMALLHEVAGVGALFGSAALAARANQLEAGLRAGLPEGQAEFDRAQDDILGLIGQSIFGGR